MKVNIEFHPSFKHPNVDNKKFSIDADPNEDIE